MSILITNTNFTDRETLPNSAPNALTMNGSYLEVINVLLSNGQQGIQASATAIDHLVYGCLIFHNGLVPGYGHGIYTQNINAAGKRYLDCMMFDNFGANFAPHGADGLVNYITLGGGTLFNAGSPVPAARNNIFWDNASDIETPVIHDICLYQGQANSVQNRLGDPDNATHDVEIYDNYLVNLNGALVLYGSSIDVTRLDGNEFRGTVDGWVTANYPDNVYATTLPVSGKHVFICPNTYNANAAFITIYNYDLSETVSVDISSLGWTGQVTARNVQDYFTDIQTLNIVDGSITVDMQAINRTVATPIAWIAPATTFPAFGAFVLERV